VAEASGWGVCEVCKSLYCESVGVCVCNVEVADLHIVYINTGS